MDNSSVERPREEWRDVLEQVTKAYQGDQVTIEVFDREYGDGYEAERLPLDYIEYDNKDDVIFIVVGARDGRYPVALRHMVWHPQALLADAPDPESVRALEIVDQDDTRTIVSLFPSNDQS